ncbi:MAG: hypothetical protein JSS65_09235 [Armatimonadetes bacterium]|nr:hypothetical protein [Armatimonadota bacterium]
MRLKVTTTALLITGLLFLLAWPLVAGHRPPPHTLALKTWGVRFATYVMLTVLVWVGVAFSALFTVRQVRRDLQKERTENLRVLLEATSADHVKKVE